MYNNCFQRESSNEKKNLYNLKDSMHLLSKDRFQILWLQNKDDWLNNLSYIKSIFCHNFTY